MRKALNDNPVVQICVIGVLLVFGGIFIVSRMGSSGGSSDQSSASSTTPTTASAVPGTSTSPTGSAVTGDSSVGAPGTASATSVPPSASAATASAPAGTVSPQALIPGPGLPKNVIVSWARGNAIVLLIVRNAGIDDRFVRASVETLNGERGITVFVARASQIARYSRITQGVGVNRVPALVVVRPRSGGSTVPEASVSYGFRNAQSVVQSVHNALYRGPDNLPYDPG
jgi:hypothetical protein